MLRRSLSARRAAMRGFGSAVTLAIALAGGAAVVTAATAAPAATGRRFPIRHAPAATGRSVSSAALTSWPPVSGAGQAERAVQVS